MQYASQSSSGDAGTRGKSPNIFFEDVSREDDDYLDKAIEGFVMFALNQGEVCTCPSRALVHEKIYDRFMEKALGASARSSRRSARSQTMIGAQARRAARKILSYIDIASRRARRCSPRRAQCLAAISRKASMCSRPCSRPQQDARVPGGNLCPVVSVTTFKDDDDALAIATTRFTASALACGAAT